MADTLVHRVTGRATASHDITINLVITDHALFGTSTEPARIPGHGPIPTDAARDMVTATLQPRGVNTTGPEHQNGPRLACPTPIHDTNHPWTVETTTPTGHTHTTRPDPWPTTRPPAKRSTPTRRRSVARRAIVRLNARPSACEYLLRARLYMPTREAAPS